MWRIHCVNNTILLDEEGMIAEELFESGADVCLAWEDKASVLDDLEGVVWERDRGGAPKLHFDPDHFEHMDYLHEREIQDVLKRHRVKGEVCFVSHDGDNKGERWGYRFDGRGGMVLLVGKGGEWIEVKPDPPKGYNKDMASTLRRTNKKPITFESKELHDYLLRRAYDVHDHRWFELVSDSEREEFVLKYATKTWNVSPTGNPTSIVVSYPRPDKTVKVYDIDAGEFFWVKLSKLTKSRITGRSTESMYWYGPVVMDDQRCESEDICDFIDWSSLEADEKKKRKR